MIKTRIDKFLEKWKDLFNPDYKATIEDKVLFDLDLNKLIEEERKEVYQEWAEDAAGIDL